MKCRHETCKRRHHRGIQHPSRLGRFGIIALIPATAFMTVFGYHQSVNVREPSGQDIQTLLLALVFGAIAVFLFALAMLATLVEHGRQLLEMQRMQLMRIASIAKDADWELTQTDGTAEVLVLARKSENQPDNGNTSVPARLTDWSQTGDERDHAAFGKANPSLDHL